MKRHLPVLAATATLLACSAVAADKNSLPPGSDTAAMAAGRTGDMSARRLDRPDAPVKATDLIGLKLENREEQKVGSVTDLALDLQSGQVVQVLVSTGGFLSLGQRTVALPPSLFRHDAPGKPLRVNLTADRLRAAPSFEMARWTDYYQSDAVAASNRDYADESTFAVGTTAYQAAALLGRSDGARSGGMGFVQKATKLMGLPVKNLADEKIGDIENLIIDLPAGRIVAVIVSSGGFLGLGDTLSAVPPAALRFNDAHDLVRLDTTRETLGSAPRFKSGEWPDFSQRAYTEGVYDAYRLTPYYSRDENTAAPAPDNAARNVRDRDNRTLTAGDQSHAAGDVKLTQQIRRDVTAADGFSVNAQNVKIITLDGHVTLRGPVRSADEKRRIGEFATRAAGAGHVDNQLEVLAP